MNESKKRITRVAAYGLVVRGERILLCRLSKQVRDKAGYWTLPGGGIEHGEDPKTTAQREIEEETGLSVEIDSLLDISSIVIANDKVSSHGIRIIYKTKDISGKIKFELDGTTDKCEWFSKSEALKLPLVSLAENGIRLAFSG